MENLIRCQRCYEWLPKKVAISAVSNMRWVNGIEINNVVMKAMGMDINYFCSECIAIIELKS